MISSFWRRAGMRPAVVVSLVLSWATMCHGGLPTAEWLPADVKFHFSIVDYPTSKPLFDETGLGQLLRDEAMLPFLKDIPNQLAVSGTCQLDRVDVGRSGDRLEQVRSGPERRGGLGRIRHQGFAGGGPVCGCDGQRR